MPSVCPTPVINPQHGGRYPNTRSTIARLQRRFRRFEAYFQSLYGDTSLLDLHIQFFFIRFLLLRAETSYIRVCIQI